MYVGLGVCVRVYILSPILSFNVQITYECYEVLKSKSLDNTCNVRQMFGIYFRKGFVRDAENPLPREFVFEFFTMQSEMGPKNCRFDGG